jgi:hypothetical protein
MRLIYLLATLAACVVAATTSATASAAATCPGTFEGAVTHGPNAGLVFSGPIVVTVGDDGTITGTLVNNDGTVVPIGGFVAGNSIHLVFDLGENGTVRGVGDLVGNDFATCTGTATGSLHGPTLQDTGNWGIVWGS